MSSEQTTQNGATLGGYIRTLRYARGLTQAQLVERLGGVVGVEQPQISQIEADRYHPFAGQLELILRALEASEADARAIRAICAREYRR